MKKYSKQNWEVPEYKFFEFRKKKTKYCICIPIINEGEKFKKQLKAMKKYSTLADILILDGGSTDKSTEHNFLKSQNVRTLLVKTGPGGQAVQLKIGFYYALEQGYEGIITIDGNGKDDPKDIPNFIKKMDEGYDYIQGSRFIKGGKQVNTPLSRFFAINFIHSPLLSLSAGKRYTDTTNGFRAYSKKYLLNPKTQPFRKIFQTYDLLFYLTVRANRVGLKTLEIPVTRSYPGNGTPTKIHGIPALFRLLTITIRVAAGYYSPR